MTQSALSLNDKSLQDARLRPPALGRAFFLPLDKNLATLSVAVFAFLAAALFSLAPARAAEPSPCAKFAWPLAKEQGWFAAQDLRMIESGARTDPNGAVAVKLRPFSEVAFAKQPERHPKTPESFGATIEVAAPSQAGRYQITLSDEAWIDVLQGGAFLKSAAFSGRKGCPLARKSVRFDIGPAPFTVQISGAPIDHINLAISPAEDH